MVEVPGSSPVMPTKSPTTVGLCVFLGMCLMTSVKKIWTLSMTSLSDAVAHNRCLSGKEAPISEEVTAFDDVKVVPSSWITCNM